MAEHEHAGRVEQAVAAIYLALVFADVLIVADVLSAGSLHRWAERRARGLYQWAAGPLRREAQVRREAAWVIWEAMQLLEEAQP